MESQTSLERQKCLLRKELRQRWAGLKVAERRLRSKKMVERLLSHPRFLAARSILTYLALSSEVETRSVLVESLKRKKKVYVPRVDEKTKEILMIEVTGNEKFSPNRYGILEPPFNQKRLGDPKSLDLVVVPGIGFDREGGRLGRGGGYFDRFLKEAAQAYKIGLAFDCQMVERIPRGPEDMAVDEVLIG